jgi:hypothetical protein
MVLTLNFESKGKACGNLTLKKKRQLFIFFKHKRYYEISTTMVLEHDSLMYTIMLIMYKHSLV